MSIHRYDAKVDLSQGGIVEGLEKAGIRVFPIGQPCDLLLQFWCNRHQNFCWQTLECKTPDSKGRRRKRHDQEKQDEFLEKTLTPVVMNFEEAWQILNTRHQLGATT